jgi:hypothetical protein
VLLQPYLPSEHPLQAAFPDRFYAVAVPSALVVAVGAFVAFFVYSVIARANAKKKAT